jgi:hypothetical protein
VVAVARLAEKDEEEFDGEEEVAGDPEAQI